jgi:hypothetical protein
MGAVRWVWVWVRVVVVIPFDEPLHRACRKPTGGVRVTYGSRNRISGTNSSSSSTSSSDKQPPLEISPPLGQMRHSKSTSQYDSIGKQLAMSKTIIRDTLRKVIDIAFGGGSDEPHIESLGSSAMTVNHTASSSKGRNQEKVCTRSLHARTGRVFLLVEYL